MPRRSVSASSASNPPRLRRKRSGVPAASTAGDLTGYQRSTSENNTPRPVATDRTQELFEAKREARRQRRHLKESGDFLGVQGINPHTGVLDVLTPTTASSEPVTDTTEERERLALGKEVIRKTQAPVPAPALAPAPWRREHAQWSSVAEPQLSPIAQSANSVTPTPSDKSAVRRKPLPTVTVPGPFLGEHRDLAGPRRSTTSTLRRVDETSGQVQAPLAKHVPASRKQANEAHTPLSLRTNDTRPVQGESSATATSSRFAQSLTHFRVPPPIPRRSGPTQRDTSPVKGSPCRHPDQNKWTGAQTPALRGRPTMSARNFPRIPSEHLTDGGAEVWADRVLQDINKLGSQDREGGHSQQRQCTMSPWGSTASAYTPTTTTTGSGDSIRRLHHTDPAAFAGALVLFKEVRTATTTSTESLRSSVPPSTPSSAGASRASSEPPASPPSMALSVWQNPCLGRLEQPWTAHSSGTDAVADAMEKLPWPRTPPSRPLPLQPSATTSAAPSTPTTYSSTSQRVRREVRATMRATMRSPRASTSAGRSSPNSTILTTSSLDSDPSMADAARTAMPRAQDGRSGSGSSSSSSSSRRSAGDDTAAMAHGAARMAFVQHAASARLVKVPRPVETHGGRVVAVGQRARICHGRHGSGGTDGPSGVLSSSSEGAAGEAKEEVLPGQTAGMVCRIAARFLAAYWLLVRPVFNADSPLRQRWRSGKATWRDYGVCGLALAFLLLWGVTALVSVRGAVLVMLGTRAVLGAAVTVLGL